MKKTLISIMLVPLLALSGCGILLPKRVELFQKTVKPVPEKTETAKDNERQAAARAALLANDTFLAAVKEGSSSNVTVPARDTARLTEAISSSLGPPSKPFTGEPEVLAAKLDRNLAKLNAKLDDYRARNEPLEGKKIEGTGLFSFGFFSMWGVILLVVVLAWAGLKIYGMINPVVGLGVNTAGRVGSTLLNKGFSELVSGGDKFRNWIGSHSSPTLTKDEVLELFTSAHKEEQSREVREVVRNLTETK